MTLWVISFFMIFTSKPARSAAVIPILFILSGSKIGFSPKVRSHVLNFTFIGAEMWQYSPQKLSKFRILAINLPLKGHLFAQLLYEILSICTRQQIAFKFFVWSLSRDKHPSYKHFPAVGAFSHKFSIAPSGETIDRIKKR